MVDTLKYNFPEAKIDFLADKRVAGLITDYPNINKVQTIEKDSLKDIKRICVENFYDLAIIVHPEFSVAWNISKGNVKYRIGTAYRWYSFLFNIKHHQHRKYSLKSEMEYNLDMLDELGCKRLNDIKPRIEVSEELLSDVKEKLKSHEIDPNKEFIVIHVPSLGSAKVWSDECFAELIRMISGDKEIDTNIILTGTQDDALQVKHVAEIAGNSDRVFTIFDLNLQELAGLLKMAKLFIGNSTGPIHIAAAVGTYAVGLYSPVKTERAIRWGPVTDKKKIFEPLKDDDLRNVMDDIKPMDVYNFVKSYLIENKS